MPTPLNIRDIGQDRKAALELEVGEVVRDWVASATAGIADEARHLEQNGPSLARFRQL